MPSLMDMLRAGDDDEPDRPKLAPDIEAIRLRDSYAALNERHTFKPGMILRQKPQVMRYRRYGDNDLVIVIELLAEPIIAQAGDHGSANYRDRLDMIVASIEEGENLAIFHVDSRCFEPVPEEN